MGGRSQFSGHNDSNCPRGTTFGHENRIFEEVSRHKGDTSRSGRNHIDDEADAPSLQGVVDGDGDVRSCDL